MAEIQGSKCRDVELGPAHEFAKKSPEWRPPKDSPVVAALECCQRLMRKQLV
jgi:hypothetical protein